jgi:hypothetical protein
VHLDAKLAQAIGRADAGQHEQPMPDSMSNCGEAIAPSAQDDFQVRAPR